MANIYVIGGGPGGYVAAIRAAQLGGTVTVVEKEKLGGTCLNVGCIPTKCMLHSADLLRELKEQGKDIGVEAESVKLNFAQVIAHQAAVSAKLSGGVAALMKLNRIKVVYGTAAFVGKAALEITPNGGSPEIVRPDAIIIAAGSVNAVPRIPGIKGNPGCIDSTGALFMDALPASMVIIGGGVIGMELGCAYNTFGTKVTIVEMMPAILPMMDGELTKLAMTQAKKAGIEIKLDTAVQSVEKRVQGSTVRCKTKSGDELDIEAEKVLVAVGRRANTETLRLEDGGIENKNGQIIVNDRMETSVPGVYAVGDCVFGQAQLAHAASAMGEVAAENSLGGNAFYDPATCPSCVYIEPEFAGVGLTEEQVKAKGIEYDVGKFPLSANGKSLILNGGTGMIKVISGKEFGEVLGVHMIGPRASDMIAEGALAIGLEATTDEIIGTIHPHPTVTEAVREAALSAQHRAIHTGNR